MRRAKNNLLWIELTGQNSKFQKSEKKIKNKLKGQGQDKFAIPQLNIKRGWFKKNIYMLKNLQLYRKINQPSLN
jgi:hypothetical protein